MAHELTYRQFVALAAYADPDREDERYVRAISGGLLEMPQDPDPSIQADVGVLVARNLVADRADEARVEASWPNRVHSRQYWATGWGRQTAHALRLELVPDEELTRWVIAKAGRQPAG